MAQAKAQGFAYVRDGILPQQTPPVSEAGVVRWARENLFSGPINSILTVLGILVVAWIIKATFPWLSHSIWDAGSMAECREIIAATWGDGARGACWAVIRDRWTQFIFGFYPSHLYARPTLALGLLFFALAPILFAENTRIRMTVLGVVTAIMAIALIQTGKAVLSDISLVLVLAALFACLYGQWRNPAKMLWLTALYPALAFWLLWGGSVWMPAAAMGGLAAVYLVFRSTSVSSGILWGGLAAVVAFSAIFLDPLSPVLNILGGLLGLFTTDPVSLDIAAGGWSIRNLFPLLPHVMSILDSWLPFGIEMVRSDKFGGFVLALTIGVSGIAMSLPLGILLALGRKSDMFLVKTLSVCFIEFIRGVPLIALLFVASLLLNYFLPPGSNFDIILRVIIMVTLFASAYIAEVIRGGLAALPRGQFEAADALGLNYWSAQRLIILPQALKISIPGIVSSFIGMFKDTTLVVFVGLLDPLKGITDAVRASTDWKGTYWEPYIFVACIFFIFNFSMSRYSMYLERKLKTDHR